MLATGVAINLGILGFFKYWNFLADTLVSVGLPTVPTTDILLPLAISFFTFQQIAFLVDARKGLVSDWRFLDYSLFVTFFPQLVAGPIVHHKDVISQFLREQSLKINRSDLKIGLIIFAIGLIKKVVVADSLAGYADATFADDAQPLSTAAAWAGTLAYSFQIYFDFSGYSDMAIGLARIFGIRLPLNFDRPYATSSIIDFWRAWHMTLSRFLRDYLYVPLGGSRAGPTRRYTNLLITMLLGGLWHGAGWTFVMWGAMHGAYLIINHAWRLGVSTYFGNRLTKSMAYQWAGRLVTFSAVTIAWVFFRAENFTDAMSIMSALFGLNDTNATASTVGWELITLLGLLLAVVWFMPSTQQWFAETTPYLEDDRHPARTGMQRCEDAFWVRYRTQLLMPFLSVLLAVAMVLVVYRSSGPPDFIYFAF